MTDKDYPGRRKAGQRIDARRLDRVVADAQQSRIERHRGYREQSLRLHPWVCGRCAREFTLENLHELTVHHKDHDHDNNPPDGSNWELLCLYCHDHEHTRGVQEGRTGGDAGGIGKPSLNHSPFAGLGSLLKK